MDIEGLGEERVRQLVGAGLVAGRGRPLRADPGAARRARAHGRDLGRATCSTAIEDSKHAAARPRDRRARHPPRRPDRGRARSRVRSASLDAIMAADDEELDRGRRRRAGDRREHPRVVHGARRTARWSRSCAPPGVQPRRAPSRRRPTEEPTLAGLHVRAHRRPRADSRREDAEAAIAARGGKVTGQRVEEDELRRRRGEPRIQAGEGRAARRDRIDEDAPRSALLEARAAGSPEHRRSRSDGRQVRGRRDRRAVHDADRARQDPRVRPRHDVVERPSTSTTPVPPIAADVPDHRSLLDARRGSRCSRR